MQHSPDQLIGKQKAGEEAVKYIENGMVIGIGTGTTAAYMIQALARRLCEGLTIVGAVPTSQATAQLASSLGIPLTDLDAHPQLDLTIDGADEIDSQLRLIKGGGGALLREKIVATISRRFIIIADSSKLVPQLGHVFPVPVETIPFARTPVYLRLQSLGAQVQLRQRDGQVFRTDSNNIILDCFFPGGINDPASLHANIKSIVGVVESGLFLGMAERAIVGSMNGVQIFTTPP
ncbi:MAG TPA: ribose-5-phosphate isomerase RpiA [Ktedonobacteraceae bacterium]|nr:ribose-5-phosphate isomerase RpiA [Ktedonobacteraceae bacterium]